MQTITVTHIDGSTSEAKVTPVVQVAFERNFNDGITVLSDTATMRMEYIYWLAWHAAKTGASFDDWLETIDAIEVEVESADPSLPAQPAA